MPDNRLIVALDVPNVVQGLELAARIGDACGFSEVAAFSRAFKNKFGTAPSHFRG